MSSLTPQAGKTWENLASDWAWAAVRFSVDQSVDTVKSITSKVSSVVGGSFFGKAGSWAAFPVTWGTGFVYRNTRDLFVGSLLLRGILALNSLLGVTALIGNVAPGLVKVATQTTTFAWEYIFKPSANSGVDAIKESLPGLGEWTIDGAAWILKTGGSLTFQATAFLGKELFGVVKNEAGNFIWSIPSKIWAVDLKTWMIAGFYLGTYFGFKLVRAHGTEFINEYIKYLGLSWRASVLKPKIAITRTTPPLWVRVSNAPIGHTRPAKWVKEKWQQVTESSAVSVASRAYHTVTDPGVRIWRWLRPQAIEPKAVFNTDLQRRVDGIIEDNRNLRRNNGAFQNVLLEGPPGLGKTMVADRIADELGMRMIKFGGSQLLSLATEKMIKDGIEHVNEIFKEAESGTPCLIFIEELDALFPARGKDFNIYQLLVINAFLSRTGTESKNFMLIGTTNRSGSLDSAFKSRMQHIVELTPPNQEARIKILKQYIKIRFRGTRELTEFFTDRVIQDIAKKVKGLTGRDLDGLVRILATRKGAHPDNRLTLEAANEQIDLFMERYKGSSTTEGKKSLARRIASVAYAIFTAPFRYTYRGIKALVSLPKKAFHGVKNAIGFSPSRPRLN